MQVVDVGRGNRCRSGAVEAQILACPCAVLRPVPVQRRPDIDALSVPISSAAGGGAPTAKASPSAAAYPVRNKAFCTR